MAWSNTPADPRTLGSFGFSNDAASAATLSGNTWSNDEAEPRNLDGLPPQIIEGIDGLETFTYFTEADPVEDDSLVLTGFGNNKLRVIDYQEWYDNALVGNQRGQIKEQSDGKRGLFLPGYIENTFTVPDETNPNAGEVTAFFKMLSGDASNWATLRIGFLVAYDNTLANNTNRGRFAIGLHTEPDSAWDTYQIGAKFASELRWDTVVYNVGDDRWDTSGGLYTIYAEDVDAQDLGLSPTAKNLRMFGNAGSSYFPVFLDITRDGSSPLSDGLTMNIWLGLSSDAVGVTAEEWAAHFSSDIDSLSRTQYNYMNATNIAFPVDHATAYTWSDFNHIFFKSLSRGLFVERVGYRIISNP